ncbi:hypothetical protein DPMN_067583 [Dreissena polymorpha]|uniref:Uncharacterized protein n=1 Tax=Dreissena polymorpha TaxID=45954 RepID=A0A9D3YY70_DREPO|nr:hypothetical protein DPMN_067583 [Dreissena polymorpha]
MGSAMTYESEYHASSATESRTTLLKITSGVPPQHASSHTTVFCIKIRTIEDMNLL